MTIIDLVHSARARRGRRVGTDSRCVTRCGEVVPISQIAIAESELTCSACAAILRIHLPAQKGRPKT